MSPFQSPTSPTMIAESNNQAAQPSLRSRLDSATMAILQTRDQVVRALDKHLQELHSLRRALGQGDTSLSAVLPPATLSVKSAMPMASPTPSPERMQPSGMSESWPTPPAVVTLRSAPQIPAPAPTPPLVGLEPVSPVPIASSLEKATLEELNTALAFAFAHVSNAHKPSATRVM
jgi:hypothetical protein